MTSETASLGRQIRFLTSELAKARRESEVETCEFQMKHLKNFKRGEAIRKKNVELHQQLSFMRSQREFARSQVDTLTTEMQRLKAELQTEQTKCKDMEEALSQQPIANLRLRVKKLCSKYHSDKIGCEKSVSCEEVSRDLLQLLSV